MATSLRVFVALLFGLCASEASARKHKHQCFTPKICLGAATASVIKRFKRKGYQKHPSSSQALCGGYLPKGARTSKKWQCSLWRKGTSTLVLVGYQKKLAFLMRNGGALPLRKKLLKRWGRPKKELRSFRGAHLFWDANGTYLIGAFFPIGRTKKRKFKLSPRPFVVFLVHWTRLAKTTFGKGLQHIRRFYQKHAAGAQWPNRCIQTLCLGDPPKAARPFMQARGFRLSKKARFRGCKKLFGKGRLRCEIWTRPLSHSVIRMVWRNHKLIFMQQERFAQPPSVRELRWVWGKERKRQWIRGMLFLQWRKAKGYRYVLSIPLFGNRRSRKKLQSRRSVGLILLDWKALRPTRMAKTLNQILKLK